MLSLTLLLLLSREKEDDLERRFVLLDQELRDILAIEGKKKKTTKLSLVLNLF